MTEGSGTQRHVVLPRALTAGSAVQRSNDSRKIALIRDRATSPTNKCRELSKIVSLIMNSSEDSSPTEKKTHGADGGISRALSSSHNLLIHGVSEMSG